MDLEKTMIAVGNEKVRSTDRNGRKGRSDEERTKKERRVELGRLKA